MDFAVIANHRVKIKETKTWEKYLDTARELKKLSNMGVTVVPTVTGSLGTVSERLERRLKELEITGQIETIQTCKDKLEYWEESWRSEDTVTQTPVKYLQLSLV